MKLHKIRVAADSELGRLLDEVGDLPVLLEKNGKVYRLSEELDELWSGYDGDRARAALARVAGSWSDVDVDRLIADLYRAREKGSRPSERP